ncbi:MAG TPA: DNA cytosine methyltransferase [Desulfovibrio sp.]|uniref:DNA cytosine methyltransferase n=1 Tax=Desulfovibrio sp. TaxID=885 RepID=UPI002C545C5E|nr:DNA cytosine methyltransferase [Desulfovibrio sp.]HMM37280.1 DNA cytosine methyltransferase [Desulfovibrio sp.]
MSMCIEKNETNKACDRMLKELNGIDSMAIQRTTTKQKSKYLKKESALKIKVPVVSLFSGCGGLDLGFVGGFKFLGTCYDKTNFDIIWANEINSAACRTYRKNIGNHIVEGDIWDALPNAPKSADVVIGGFPCQDISVNGKGAGVDGKRSGLYRAMVEAVSRIRPKVFIAENVKGLLMKHNKQSLLRVLTDFRALGYEVSYRLYHAADYGVPQTRERVFIVGTRPDVPAFVHPEPVYANHISAREAIGDLERMDMDRDFNHIWSLANKSAEQGNRKLIAERPGYTIRAECHGNIQFHYSLPRRISMREAARFQSFPDNFIFDAKLRETERQIGNAVPPVLAWHIAKAVESVLKGGTA